MCKVQSIQQSSFERYGKVIEFPIDYQEAFHIVMAEEKVPWRLAVFRYTNQSITQLERHPSSMESFEPLQGMTLLVVAEADKPEQYEAFILDKPVCLYKNIWHQVLSITEEAQVKITENYEVHSEFYELTHEITLQIG